MSEESSAGRKFMVLLSSLVFTVNTYRCLHVGLKLVNMKHGSVRGLEGYFLAALSSRS